VTPNITVDDSVIENSPNPVSGGAVYDALAGNADIPQGVNLGDQYRFTYNDATSELTLTPVSTGLGDQYRMDYVGGALFISSI